MVGWLADAGAFLLGRRTYEIFAAYWPKVTDPSNPIAARLNGLPEIRGLEVADGARLGALVAASAMSWPAWPSSSVAPAGAAGATAAVNLARTLIAHDLVDEYRLLAFPLLLGSGKRLFPGGDRGAALRLTGARTTGAGVVVYTCVPDGPVRHGSYAET